MISTKLLKQAEPSHLLIEFSQQKLSPLLLKFYNNCKDEGILTRRSSAIQDNQMNFHLVQAIKKSENQNFRLPNAPNNITFIISVIYINCEQDEQRRESISPTYRTLLLRQGLDAKFYLEYQFENTQSQQESIVFLCYLSASIINSQFSNEINFYDQSTSEIKSKKQNESPSQTFWINVLFQIPGLGQDKCMAIVQKYPNYQSLLKDYHQNQQLKDLPVKRGIKESRLGDILAKRIYKCLFTKQWQQSVLQRKQ